MRNEWALVLPRIMCCAAEQIAQTECKATFRFGRGGAFAALFNPPASVTAARWGRPTQRIAIMMMSKRLLAGFAGAMAMGLAVPAMAEEVTNTVTVEPTASLTVDHAALTLILDGTQGPENYDTFMSGIKHLNNTTADVSIAIAATALPDDMNYWLFRDHTEAAAIAALQADAAHSPVLDGIFRYTGAAVNLGVATTLYKSVAISTDTVVGDPLPVVYAADARNSLPPPASHVTTVTWTIAPTP
jgi:hypothetical protein